MMDENDGEVASIPFVVSMSGSAAEIAINEGVGRILTEYAA